MTGRGSALWQVLGGAWHVFVKEWRDALRDRRTLAVVVLSSVALGPALLVALSTLVSSLETRAERREIWMSGAEHAPTLVNFIERQGFALRAAPVDHERQQREQQLQDAVVVVAAGFEAELAAGLAPRVQVLSRSADARSQTSAARAEQLLAAFAQDQAQWRLAWRGVAPLSLQAVQVQAHDLADPAARALQFTGVLPFFVLMAMLYGALTAALDTTAGERERGSLEPLLMNPTPVAALVLGKWAAVTAVALLIALLSVFSFLPGQWLLRSETLAALFRFGPAEGLRFLVVLAPLGAALSALLMAVAMRCASVREAQAHASVVLLVASVLPLASLLQQGAEAGWHLWVPVLAQVTLMNRVLRGEALGAGDALLASGMALGLALVALASVLGPLRRAALGAR